MKKKVLFVCYGLGIGGIEKCMVNLINALPEEKYEIDILLMNPEYALKDQIHRKVCYIDTFEYVMNTTDTVPEIKKRGGIRRNPGWFLRYCLFRVANKMQKKAWRFFKPVPQKYDVAIAYSQNDFSPYYVQDMVTASRKVMWYHNGAYEGEEKKKLRDQQYYPRFDYFVAVSSDCKRVLEKNFSFDKNRLIVLRNICATDQVCQKALEFVPESYKKNVIHITTVGRMTKEKGTDIALEACKELKRQGYKFCWHWIGDGNCAEVTKHKIKENGLEDVFVLEGNQINPYPFIKNSDIYVQPSYYEAYSTTITEAKILHRPIVTTDVGGMRDQIEHGKNGLIVPVDALRLSQAIQELFDDSKLREDFSHTLQEESFDTQKYMDEYEKTVFNFEDR